MQESLLSKITGYLPKISQASDFPTVAVANKGAVYYITATVTDSDSTKTNTGGIFHAGNVITWNTTTNNSWIINDESFPIIIQASDFPTLGGVQEGHLYLMGASVTDNDPTKTNTGISFDVGDMAWWQDSAATYRKITAGGGGGGTVTSVNGAGGDTEEYIAVTGGPITTSGTLTVDLTARIKNKIDSVAYVKATGGQYSTVYAAVQAGKKWIFVDGEDADVVETNNLVSSGEAIINTDLFILIKGTWQNRQIMVDPSTSDSRSVRIEGYGRSSVMNPADDTSDKPLLGATSSLTGQLANFSMANLTYDNSDKTNDNSYYIAPLGSALIENVFFKLPDQSNCGVDLSLCQEFRPGILRDCHFEGGGISCAKLIVPGKDCLVENIHFSGQVVKDKTPAEAVAGQAIIYIDSNEENRYTLRNVTFGLNGTNSSTTLPIMVGGEVSNISGRSSDEAFAFVGVTNNFSARDVDFGNGTYTQENNGVNINFDNCPNVLNASPATGNNACKDWSFNNCSFNDSSAFQPKVSNTRISSCDLPAGLDISERSSFSISSITYVGQVGTVTTNSAHGLSTGDFVWMKGSTVDADAYNIGGFITVTSTTTFTYELAYTPAGNASGTLEGEVLPYNVQVENCVISGVVSGSDSVLMNSYFCSLRNCLIENGVGGVGRVNRVLNNVLGYKNTTGSQNVTLTVSADYNTVLGNSSRSINSLSGFNNQEANNQSPYY